MKNPNSECVSTSSIIIIHVHRKKNRHHPKYEIMGQVLWHSTLGLHLWHETSGSRLQIVLTLVVIAIWGVNLSNKSRGKNVRCCVFAHAFEFYFSDHLHHSIKKMHNLIAQVLSTSLTMDGIRIKLSITHYSNCTVYTHC